MAALLIVEQKEGRNVRKKARMRGRDNSIKNGGGQQKESGKGRKHKTKKKGGAKRKQARMKLVRRNK